MVSILVSKAVDRGFIGGVMVSVLVSKVLDRGLIGCIMVSVLVSKAVDHGFIDGRSTALETRMLTRSGEPTIYRFRDKNANLLHHR
jgi:hypothetical protein